MFIIRSAKIKEKNRKNFVADSNVSIDNDEFENLRAGQRSVNGTSIKWADKTSKC